MIYVMNPTIIGSSGGRRPLVGRDVGPENGPGAILRIRGYGQPVKLVVIYGPPAVGKLTTANALAKLTDLPVFHNHLSFDLVTALFAFPSPAFLRLLEAIRLRVFDAAAQEGMAGLIFTFVYGRRGTGKIVTVESWRGLFSRANLTARIPSRDGLDIDNSSLTPDAVARRIVDHFSLVDGHEPLMRRTVRRFITSILEVPAWALGR